MGVVCVSRGQDFSRFNASARSYLEPEVGPVEDPDQGCEVGACDESAVYRVPWPNFGGDIAYCGFHLARYRHEHGELWERFQGAPVDDPDEFACRGQQFLALGEVPEKIRGGRYRCVALTQLGLALYEQTTPDDGVVTYVLVDRSPEYDDALRVEADRASEFLHDFDRRRGVYERQPDVREALYESTVSRDNPATSSSTDGFNGGESD